MTIPTELVPEIVKTHANIIHNFEINYGTTLNNENSVGYIESLWFLFRLKNDDCLDNYPDIVAPGKYFDDKKYSSEMIDNLAKTGDYLAMEKIFTQFIEMKEDQKLMEVYLSNGGIFKVFLINGNKPIIACAESKNGMIAGIVKYLASFIFAKNSILVGFGKI